MTLREVTPVAGTEPEAAVVRAVAALESEVFGPDAW